MNRTRTTLYYPATYLTLSGAMLLAAPDFALKLLFSNGGYGPWMPRLGGTLMLGLGFIVIQIIRHEVDVLYPTLVAVRVFFCAMWMWFWLGSGDPFFLAVFATVAVGMVWTGVSLLMERRKPA